MSQVSGQKYFECDSDHGYFLYSLLVYLVCEKRCYPIHLLNIYVQKFIITRHDMLMIFKATLSELTICTVDLLVFYLSVVNNYFVMALSEVV